MNTQEIFDKIVLHLHTQGEQAYDPSGVCRYRTEDGLKCAVGVLIPDAVYSEEMEGCGVDEIIQNYKKLNHLVPYEDLLMSAQHVHDNTKSTRWHLIYRHLFNIAKRFSLDTSLLNKLEAEYKSKVGT